MNKSKLYHSILHYTNNSPFISITQFAKMMHIGRDSARAMLAGLDYIQNGNRKDFFVEDVAALLNDKKAV